MINIGNTVSTIWNYIGSYWSSYEHKDDIEKLWFAAKTYADALYDRSSYIRRQKSLKAVAAYYDDPDTYINISEITLSGDNILFAIPKWTYSIPSLSRASNPTEIYYEGVDYEIIDFHFLHWLRTAQRTIPVPGGIFKASQLKRLNRVFYELWYKLIGMTVSIYSQYRNYAADRYTYVQYLVWALVYFRTQPATLHNIKRAYGISKGLAFALTPGVVTYSGASHVVIGDFVYNVSGMSPVPNGTYVNTFDSLVHDSYFYVTTSGNTVKFRLSNAISQATTNDSAFRLSYLKGILPASITFTEEVF